MVTLVMSDVDAEVVFATLETMWREGLSHPVREHLAKKVYSLATVLDDLEEAMSRKGISDVE